MEKQHNEINPEHVINSLSNRNAKLDKENAYKDAIIIKQSQQIAELEKDVENLRNQLKEKAK